MLVDLHCARPKRYSRDQNRHSVLMGFTFRGHGFSLNNHRNNLEVQALAMKVDGTERLYCRSWFKLRSHCHGEVNVYQKRKRLLFGGVRICVWETGNT